MRIRSIPSESLFEELTRPLSLDFPPADHLSKKREIQLDIPGNTETHASLDPLVGNPITVIVACRGSLQRPHRTVHFPSIPRLGRIVTAIFLIILVLGIFATIVPLKDPVRPINVSYNPYPADRYHAPLSGMGLIMAINGTPSVFGSGSLTGQPVRSGGQSIRQNGLRFIIDDSYFPQTETSVAVDPNNTNHVLGAFNDQKYFFCGSLPADCAGNVPVSLSGFSVSIDGGKTIAKTGDLPRLPVGSFVVLIPYGDPSVAPTTDGNFFYSSLGFDEITGRNGILLAKSNSNLFDPAVSCVTSLTNRTFNPCWTVSFVFGNALIFSPTLEDKDLMVVDQDPTSPYYGYVYISWDHFFAFSGSQGYLARCDSNLSCVMVPGFTQPALTGDDFFVAFTTPVIGKGGTIAVTWCDYGTPFTWGPVICSFRSSTAGGLSFGSRSTILSFMGAGTMLPNATVTLGWATEQFRTQSVPNIAADLSGKTQNLYFAIQVCVSGFYDAFSALQNPFVAQDNPGNCGSSLVLLQRSMDGGSTWSAPLSVSQRAVNDQPYVTVDTVTGSVYVLYYTTQFDSFNHRLDVVASKSMDGGVHWRQSRVTSASNEPNSDPNMFQYYSQSGGALSVPQYGDYFQAVAMGGTLWVLFTGNYAVEAGTFQTDPFLIVANI